MRMRKNVVAQLVSSSAWSMLCCLLPSAFCLLLTAGSVRADEPAASALKADIELLKDRLAQLELKLAEQETVSSGAATGAAVVQLPSALHGVQMSGFVDTSATYSFNAPQTRTNTLRAFDTQSNSFMLNNAELVLEKPVTTESPVGFKTSLMFGSDAEVTGAVTSGLGSGTDELDIQQAYVEYLAPVGEGLDLKIGKFATLHGAEVIESKDDWNISRSFLFTYAIPFTHTGLRASYPWTDWLLTCFGVNNGWDVVDDNNSAKTIEASLTLTPTDALSLTSTYMVGAEQPTNTAQPVGASVFGSNTHQRHLIDVVAGYQPFEALQLKANFDYGFEEKGVGIGKNARWFGLAGYARYALTDRWALAGRTEWFHDADGVRTVFRPSGSGSFGIGNPVGINGISGLGLRMWEFTLTNEYKLNKHLISRLEYRHDQASEQIFRRQDVGQRPYQDTVSVEFIAPF